MGNGGGRDDHIVCSNGESRFNQREKARVDARDLCRDAERRDGLNDRLDERYAPQSWHTASRLTVRTR